MVVQVHSHRAAPSIAGSPAPDLTPKSIPHQATSPLTPTLSNTLPSIKIKKRSSKAIHRERLRLRSRLLDSKLVSAKKKFVDEVTALGKEYHKSPREIQSRALIKNKFGIAKRKANAYNAFRRAQSKARRESGNSLPFSKTQAEDLASYRQALESDPDAIEAACKELENEKIEKSGHVYKNIRARVQHSDKVIRGIDTAVKELNLSCEVEAICLFVNGSNRDHPLLQAVYTPKGLAFVEGPLKHNIDNVLHDFRTFASSGSSGLSKKHKDVQAELRAQVSALLLRSLQAAVNDPNERIGKMAYTNFEERVCKKYGVELVGWPEEAGSIRNPALIGNNKLKKIIATLKSGQCVFKKATGDCN